MKLKQKYEVCKIPECKPWIHFKEAVVLKLFLFGVKIVFQIVFVFFLNIAVPINTLTSKKNIVFTQHHPNYQMCNRGVICSLPLT